MKDPQALLEERMPQLKALSFSQVAGLPEAQGESVGPYKLTTFHQRLSGNRHLVTLQVAKPRLLGLFSSHWERGVVFAEGSVPREATSEELVNGGG
jgi:hypothetical protein